MDLGIVKSFEASCIVPDDPGEVVRRARPLCQEDRERLREQAIARLLADYSRQPEARLVHLPSQPTSRKSR